MTDRIPAETFPGEGRITDLVIRIGILGLFIYWTLALLKPFLPIMLWSVVLAVALSPVHGILTRWFGGRPRWAAVVLTIISVLVVGGPVAALVANMVDTIHDLTARADSGTLRIPAPPASLAGLPLFGEELDAAWRLASVNLEAAAERYHAVLVPFGHSVLLIVSSASIDIFRFIAAVIVAGFLYVPGARLGAGGRRFASRITAPRGAQFVDMAGATIRNVARGVVGVALLQAVATGILFQIAGVPGSGLLAFIIFVLCIVQIGPAPVVLPVLIWVWFTFPMLHALLLTVVMVPVGIMDNVLKPILMSRGLRTPALVIFIGVLGGTMSYGLIGLFLGPIVLAVFYDLVTSWAGEATEPIMAPPPPPS